MAIKHILFDLDGTLTDSKLGITRCVQYALKSLGIDEPDLDKLECGDTFYVHTLDETMAYMVLEINTVLPEDTSKLVILPEHDVCTLVTCTPYGVNTHRLMVRGTRIRNDQAEYVENLKAEKNEREGVTQSTWQQEYFKGIGLGAICIAAIGIVYEINRIRPRRRKRGLHEKS